MRAVFNGISAVCLLVLLILGISFAVSAHEKEEGNVGINTELLIVIDNSGSMKSTYDFLAKVVSLIKLLAEERDISLDVSFLLFNEDAYFIDSSDEIVIEEKKETCVLQGIKYADQWMEERINCGINAKVLFISDLFSSRYMEKGTLKRYDLEVAIKEQKDISEIEEKWKTWSEEQKASIMIWTWESMCTSEKTENTVENLKKNEGREIENGYQVKFEPTANVEIYSNEKEANTMFVKLSIQSFEKLLNGVDAEWRDYRVFSGRKKEVDMHDNKVVYLYFPDADDDIEIKGGTGGNVMIIRGLYILTNHENQSKYIISLNSDKKKTEGYKIEIPNLKWTVGFEENNLKVREEFTVILSPSVPIEGSWGSPNEYSCSVTIKEKQNDQIIFKGNMPYANGEFSCKSQIDAAGTYQFIWEIEKDGSVEVIEKVRAVN